MGGVQCAWLSPPYRSPSNAASPCRTRCYVSADASGPCLISRAWLSPATVRLNFSPSARRTGPYTCSLCLLYLHTITRRGHAESLLQYANRGACIGLRKTLSGLLTGSVCVGQLDVSHDYYITTWCGGSGRSYQRQTAGVANPVISISMLGGAPCATCRRSYTVGRRRVGRSSAVMLAAAPPHNQYFIALMHAGARTLISRRDVIRYEHKLSSLSNYL